MTGGKLLTALTAALVLALLHAPVTAAEIHEAAGKGDLAAVKAILKKDPGAVNASSGDGGTALHYAADGGHLDVVSFLLRNGAEADARNAGDQTALLYAAYKGHEKIVELLIKQGAAFNYQDTRGRTPLHFAAREGRPEVVELLLSKGADIDHRDEIGDTPLYLAAITRNLEIARLLAGKGADIKNRNRNGETPLKTAIGLGFDEIVDMLVERGALEDLGQEEAAALLHRAAGSGYEEIAERLMSSGAGMESENAMGGSLLHSAAIGGLTDLAGRLMERGADVDAADRRGRTPLHYAVENGNGRLAGLLVGRGGDPNVKGVDGRTPLHIAEDWKRKELADLLKANGALEVPRDTYKLKGRAQEPGEKAAGGDTAPVAITYIANEGFMISKGGRKVMIDAVQSNPYYYANTNDEIFEMMLESKPPFDGLDVIVASHPHQDHFSAEMTARLLSRREDLIFVSSQQSCDDLGAAAGADSVSVEGRVRNATPSMGSTIGMNLNDVDVELLGINHAPPQADEFLSLATVLDLDGVRILHLADLIPESNVENIREADAIGRGVIDIAFIDPWFLQDSTGSATVRELIRPEHIILMHVRDFEVDGYARRFAEDWPELIVFREPMETKLFKR